MASVGWNCAHQTLVDCSDETIGGLSMEPKTIAVALHSKGFISFDLLEEIDELPVTKKANARKLYFAIVKSVQHCPHKYSDFISILHKNTLLYHDLLKALEQTFSDNDTAKKLMPTLEPHQSAVSDQSCVPYPQHYEGNTSPAERVKWFESRFHDLRRSALTETKQLGVTVEEFRQTLMTLPYALSKEHEGFILEKYSIFKQAESIEDIFLHLNFYLSFIDFSLLEHITEHFGSPDLQQKMEQYSKDMKEFRTDTVVSDIIPHLPGRPEPPPYFAKLKKKLDLDPKTCTLEDLEQHRKKFGSEFSLSKFTLFLVELSEGSLVEVWLIPSDIIPSLKELVRQKEECHFVDLKILELRIDEECLYLRPGPVPPSPALPTVPVSSQEDENQMLARIFEGEDEKAKREMLSELSSQIKSTPKSQGVAFFVSCATSRSPATNSLLKSCLDLASTFKKLNFAVYESRVNSQFQLYDMMCDIVSVVCQLQVLGYLNSDNSSVIVVVDGLGAENIDTLLIGMFKEISHISHDIIEPFLPPATVTLIDIPKIFFINTIDNYWPRSSPTGTFSLHVPPPGNLIVSYTASDDLEYLSHLLCLQLTGSRQSIQEMLANFKDQLPSGFFMTVESHLDKPLYICSDSPLKPSDTEAVAHTKADDEWDSKVSHDAPWIDMSGKVQPTQTDTEAVVLFDYSKANDDELSLKVGQRIQDVVKFDDGWYYGTLNEKRGMFPGNRVRLQPPQTDTEGVVLFDYDKADDDELNLKVGQRIRDVVKFDDGWYYGTLNEEQGMFPGNRVRLHPPQTDTEGIVLFDYDKADDDELSLKVGQRIQDVVKFDDGWYYGTLNGKRGMFPGNRVRLQPPEVSREPLKNRCAKVLYSYISESLDELTLEPGQIIRNVHEMEEEEGWFRGTLNGKEGVFPSNFVEIIS